VHEQQNRARRRTQALPTWARAYAQGQWSAAIELLETIPETSRTAWHWLHLARALEKRTELVESFGAYERLLDLVAESAALPGMKDVERQAKMESGALSRRIPWAEVSIGEDLPAGALVFVDQQWLEPARLRSPYPVNPGWHTFLVESNGEVLAARRTFFEEGQSRVIPLSSFSEQASPQAAGAGPKGDGTRHRHQLTWHGGGDPIDTDRQDQLRTASYVSLGVGVLGTVLGTGFAVDASGDSDRSGAGEAVASYAVGFGALVTGGVLWSLYRRAPKSSAGLAHVMLEPSVYPGGAAVRGTF
jgi:hypothetical protein